MEAQHQKGPGVWIFIATVAFLIAVLVSRSGKNSSRNVNVGTFNHVQNARSPVVAPNSGSARSSVSKGEQTPEQIVAGMVNQFGRSRRELALAMGRKAGKEMPLEVKQFFDAVEAGNWEEIDRLGKFLGKKSGQYNDSDEAWEELNPFWPAVLDAYGVAEQAHMWPAQKLLDYGNAILDSMPPGMAYVGGTDPGRWIPELINEASGENPRIIVTQNAFADARYIDFMEAQYGDRMSTLTQEDTKAVFEEYKADALKRLEHDEKFPNEPKQIKPGENVKLILGKAEISGQAAVMAINERLFQLLMEKNPGMSFGIEQSHPFKSTFPNAGIMGPIMEIGAPEENALTPERAGEAVNYWRKESEKLLGADGLQDEKLRQAYAKLASNQAQLLNERGFTAEAEQTYRFAAEMAVSSPEALYGYANILTTQGRGREAIPLVEKAIAIDPKKESLRTLLEQLRGLKN